MASAVAPVPFALSALPRPVRRVLLVDESPKDLHLTLILSTGKGIQFKRVIPSARVRLV